MALIPMWKCDRDGKLFDDKKAAEQHDKMLELAANISCWVEAQIPGIDEQQLEALGLLMARNKDKLQAAIKGKPEVLLEPEPNDNVTAIAQ